MDIGSVLQSAGVNVIDLVVVLCIVLLTQIVKRYAGIKRWLVLVPIVLGVGFGFALHFGDGVLLAVVWGFVLGVIATWLYSFGTKFLGFTLPGNAPKQ